MKVITKSYIIGKDVTSHAADDLVDRVRKGFKIVGYAPPFNRGKGDPNYIFSDPEKINSVLTDANVTYDGVNFKLNVTLNLIDMNKERSVIMKGKVNQEGIIEHITGFDLRYGNEAITCDDWPEIDMSTGIKARVTFMLLESLLKNLIPAPSERISYIMDIIHVDLDSAIKCSVFNQLIWSGYYRLEIQERITKSFPKYFHYPNVHTWIPRPEVVEAVRKPDFIKTLFLARDIKQVFVKPKPPEKITKAVNRSTKKPVEKPMEPKTSGEDHWLPPVIFMIIFAFIILGVGTHIK